MFFSVLPLRAYAFQILFLLMAIAVEAYILRRELKLLPRQALQYAAALNFFTVGLGWFVFVNVQGILPPELQREVLNFVFFGRWSSELVFWLIVVGFAAFFLSFFLKVFAFNQLQFLLMTPQEWANREEKFKQRHQLGGKRPRQSLSGNSAQASAILTANAISYTAITLVLLLRFLIDSQIVLPQ